MSRLAEASRPSISAASARLALFIFLFAGFLLRVFTALAVPISLHPDEVFQTQEPAHRLAFGYGVITWEWIDGIRSWVFPAFLAGVMRATDWMGSGSSGYRMGIALVLSLLSLTTIWFAFAWAERASGTEAAIIAGGTCTFWYITVAYGPRAFSEVVATHALLPGLYFGVYGERLGERKRMFLAGVLCGLAACLRIQFAPAVALAAAYFCVRPSTKSWKKKLVLLALGLCIPVALFGVVDAKTWSYPFQSVVRYFSANVVHGSGALFGSQPWYLYVAVILPAGLGPLLIPAIWGLQRSPFLGWLSLAILLSHSVIPHKEIRFIYPVWPLGITLAALGIVDLAASISARRQSPLSPGTVVAAGLSLPVFVAISLLIALHYFNLGYGAMAAFDRLSKERGICGVGLVNIRWTDTGGYTHLHHDVPIIVVPDEAHLPAAAASFNAALSRGTLSQPPDGFSLQQCRNRICLYERPGACTPATQGEINSVVAAEHPLMTR